MVEILVQADGFLDPVPVDLLLEVAVPIEETDRDEVQVEVTGGFAMIARENAEAAGVVGDRFMETELSGEIGNGPGEDAGGLAVDLFELRERRAFAQRETCESRGGRDRAEKNAASELFQCAGDGLFMRISGVPSRLITAVKQHSKIDAEPDVGFGDRAERGRCMRRQRGRDGDERDDQKRRFRGVPR